MNDWIVGIDIGSRGAISLLDGQGDLMKVADMPVLNDGPSNRRTVNAPLLAGLIRDWGPCKAYVELVSARPKEGAVGAFAFGRSRGILEGVLAAQGIPLSWITPAQWKRLVGISYGSKDCARSEAIRRWPTRSAHFARAMDDGRAEAALIGIAGLLRSRTRGEME